MKSRLLIVMTMCWFALSTARGNEGDIAIVSINLNGEDKGEFVGRLLAVNDFLLEPRDLEAIGFTKLPGQAFDIEGKTYISLKSLKGVSFSYDERHLSLHIKSDPSLLRHIKIDWAYKQQTHLLFPKGASMFFNYGVSQELGASSGAFSSTQETGVRIGDFLLLSDSRFTHADDANKAVRLMTSLTRDNRNELTRTVFGDVYIGSGDLGSDLLIGGFQFSKKYSMDPSVWKQSMLDYSGFVSLPSQVDIYVDGMQIGSEKVSPGGFDLKNIPISDGFHGLEVRVRDALGREQTLTRPYYSSEILLRKGYHEYSYGAGLRRQNFGMDSNRYNGLAFAANHQYGISSDITLGFRMEGSPSLWNGGGRVAFRLWRMGITDSSTAISIGKRNQRGAAVYLSHSFLGKYLNFRFQAAGYSKNYSTLNSLDIADKENRPHYELKTGISYRIQKLGSIALDLAAVRKFSQGKNSSYGITYTRNIRKTLSVSATYRQITLEKKDHQYFVMVNYFPQKSVSLSAGYQAEAGGGTEMVQLQKNPPSGTGLSYRVLMQKRQGENGHTTVSPYIQYNGPCGIYSLDYRKRHGMDAGDDDYMEVSASGSVVFSSGVWGFSRPVNDSFAIVRINGIRGVRASHNNQEVGVTNRSGKIVIPNMNAYVDNIVAINDQDIPVNYALNDVTRHLSPSWRSGALIDFEAKKTQAVTGKLFLKTESGDEPLALMELSIENGDETVPFITARDGEFYLENIAGGSHVVRFTRNRKSVVFTLKMPVSEAIMVDLGKVVIEQAH